MGRLWFPFVAASAALLIFGLLLGPRLFPQLNELPQLAAGLVVGFLASIVLYALMRALAARPS